jgi:transglutaminase-like putative cysteine protease
MPVTGDCQRCLKFDVSTEPTTKIFSFSEVGGRVHHFTLRSPHRSLTIHAESEVETYCTNPFDGLNLIGPDWDFYKLDSTKDKWAEFLAPSRFVMETAGAAELAEKVLRESHGVTTQFLLGLNRYLFEHLTYDPHVTDVHSTVAEVLELRAGVCQDFAHLMIACCRSVGVPARYVSGYLHSSRGSGIRGNEGMHAWLECPLPDGNWLALDPTNNLLANDHHIRVHTGRDYADITPLRGLYKGVSARKMDVEIQVREVAPAEHEVALMRQDIA